MKLQKQKAREYEGKPIYKYVIVIPPNVIKKLGWTKGQELKGTLINDVGYLLTKN